MANQVTFSDCLNAGIKIAGIGALIGGAFGRSVPMIVSNGVGSLVGITAGNYMLHNTEACRKFDASTKSILVIALSILVSSAVFGGFSLVNRNLSVSKFVQGQFSSALIYYLLGWGVVNTRTRAV